MGLMQLMPETWAEIRDRLGLGPDPDDPRDNILAGSFYLRSLYGRFGYPGLFAAYHSGPGRYAKFLEGRAPLPPQTVAYLDRLVGKSGGMESSPVRAAPIFAILGEGQRPVNSEEVPPLAVEPSGLFVPLEHGDDRATSAVRSQAARRGP